MVEALIIDACRTPRGIGKAGKGALSDIHPQHLGAAVLSALRERSGIDTAEVDDIIWGTSAQAGQQTGDIGRMSALDAGYDVRASGVTIIVYASCAYSSGRPSRRGNGTCAAEVPSPFLVLAAATGYRRCRARWC